MTSSIPRRHAVGGLIGLTLAPRFPTDNNAQNAAATYVLVHGAWHGGWCWKKVVTILRAAHNVYTPTLTGLGERSHLGGPTVNLSIHVQDIVNLLTYEDLERVILV